MFKFESKKHMIPKIIHYCWMSQDNYPDKIQYCINSWRKLLPDYKIIKWDYSNFPRGTSAYVDEAYDLKKYAFCADWLRIYALKEYGGIYLDSDVEIVKSFDDLLSLPYFVCQEETHSQFEAAVIGCQKGWNLINDMFKLFQHRHFAQGSDVYDVKPLPYKFRECIVEKDYELRFIEDMRQFDMNERVVNVFPVEYFSANSYKTHRVIRTENTYSIHHFAGSWLDQDDNLRNVTQSNKNIT